MPRLSNRPPASGHFGKGAVSRRGISLCPVSILPGQTLAAAFFLLIFYPTCVLDDEIVVDAEATEMNVLGHLIAPDLHEAIDIGQLVLYGRA